MQRGATTVRACSCCNIPVFDPDDTPENGCVCKGCDAAFCTNCIEINQTEGRYFLACGTCKRPLTNNETLYKDEEIHQKLAKMKSL